MICLYKSQIINNGFQNLSHLSCIWYQKIFHSSYLFCHISQIYMFHIIHQISQHISQTMNHISCHVSKLNHFRISHFHIIYMCVRVCDFHIWKEQHMTHIVYHISFLKIHAYNTCIYICVYYICLFNYLHATCSCKFRTCTNTSILPKHQNTHTIIYIYVCVCIIANYTLRNIILLVLNVGNGWVAGGCWDHYS